MRRGRTIIKKCKNCEKDFEVLLIKIRAGKGLFCSNQCYHEYQRKNKIDEKEANIFYQKKCKYGLSKDDYLKLVSSQKNKCAICGISFNSTRACVDHSHTNGNIRGLLCDKCNRGIGSFNDDITLLNKAIDYLKINTVS